MNLATTYLGLRLRSPLCEDIENLRRMEDSHVLR